VASYFADSQAVAWHAAVMRSGSRTVTTEAVLWGWLNALADTTTRATAAEGYRRTRLLAKIR